MISKPILTRFVIYWAYRSTC